MKKTGNRKYIPSLLDEPKVNSIQKKKDVEIHVGGQEGNLQTKQNKTTTQFIVGSIETDIFNGRKE